MRNHLHVRLIPQVTIHQLRGMLVRTHLHVRLIPKGTTGQFPFSYRGTLLSIFARKSHSHQTKEAYYLTVTRER
jgi:hypothetical protein